jgi:hypothetical protein
MKHIFLAALSTIPLLSACNEAPEKKQTTPEKVIVTDTVATTRDFYKRLEGSIAEKPIVMHLHQFGEQVEGVYYYTDKGLWLTLTQDSVANDSIYLSESVPGDNWSEQIQNNAHFIVSIEKDGIKGRWVSGDKTKSYPITLSEVYPQGSYRFSVQSFTDSVKALQNKKESPQAQISYTFVVPQQNDWLDTQVKSVLHLDSTESFKAGFTKAKEQYFEQYKKELPSPDDTTGMPLAVYNYTEMQQLYVRFNQKGFVVLENFFYSFTGGAHGMHGSTFYCYDVANKKQLQLSDITTADSATLQPLVEKYFRKQYRIKEPSLKGVLFDRHISANNNFYFNRNGIGFVYNPYEVASYAQGQVNVFVPFSELKLFLNPEFAKRLGI